MFLRSNGPPFVKSAIVWGGFAHFGSIRFLGPSQDFRPFSENRDAFGWKCLSENYSGQVTSTLGGTWIHVETSWTAFLEWKSVGSILVSFARLPPDFQSFVHGH